MKNVEELRNKLIKLVEQVENGTISSIKAKMIMNMCSKILISAKYEVDYNKYRECNKMVKFFETELNG